jgi:hypothetical protein
MELPTQPIIDQAHDDLLWGAKEIAAYCQQLGVPMTPKKVYQWRRAGKLPIGKIAYGAHVIASKAKIRQALDAATGQAPKQQAVPTPSASARVLGRRRRH